MNERTCAPRAALILILPMLALACGGSSGGKASTGGSSGTTGGSGGVTAGGGGSGGAGGIAGNQDGGAAPTGSAKMKFCNGLALAGNANLRLTLNIGDPPLSMSADSGTCSTPVGTACKMVPAGDQPVTLVDDMNREVASGTVTVGANEEWMMLATLDKTTMQPTVVGGALKPQFNCAAVNPFMVPDGGVTGGGDAGGN